MYPDRESNPDLLFRRELFYPLNYQDLPFIRLFGCKININERKNKINPQIFFISPFLQ